MSCTSSAGFTSSPRLTLLHPYSFPFSQGCCKEGEVNKNNLIELYFWKKQVFQVVRGKSFVLWCWSSSDFSSLLQKYYKIHTNVHISIPKNKTNSLEAKIMICLKDEWIEKFWSKHQRFLRNLMSCISSYTTEGKFYFLESLGLQAEHSPKWKCPQQKKLWAGLYILTDTQGAI